MRKFYREYLHIPKDGKVREIVFFNYIAASVAFILACMMMMGYTGYAYFTCSVTSEANIIKSAGYDLDIDVEVSDTFSENGTESETDTDDSIEIDYTQPQVFKADEVYYVTLSIPDIDNTVTDTAQAVPADDTDTSDTALASTGFCVIKVEVEGEDAKIYYTQQIGVDESVEGGYTKLIEFTIELQNDATITFTPHWGTSSYYGYASYDEKSSYVHYIENGNTIK